MTQENEGLTGPQVSRGSKIGCQVTDAKVSQGIIDNWWRQGMMGGTKAHYDCIKVFSETDHTEDDRQVAVMTRPFAFYIGPAI